MQGRKFSDSYSLGVGIDKDASSEATKQDESRVKGLDSVFGILGKWKRDRGLAHEDLMAQPLALLLLEDIDQPYIDYKSSEEDKEETPVIEGAVGLRNLLGIKPES